MENMQIRFSLYEKKNTNSIPVRRKDMKEVMKFQFCFFFVLFNKVFIDISIFIHILMMANFIHFFPINAIEMEKNSYGEITHTHKMTIILLFGQNK